MAMYQGRRSTYDLTIDDNKKIFHAQASGFFDVEDGESFMKEYDRLTKPLQPNTMSLIINAPELQPSSPQVAQMLGVLLQKYIEVPFKARFFVTNGNPVTQMQFNRLGKSIPGWTEGVQYVDDYAEALSKIK
jgi:hypothetical protein